MKHVFIIFIILGIAAKANAQTGYLDFFAESLISRETEQNAFEYYLNTGLVYR